MKQPNRIARIRLVALFVVALLVPALGQAYSVPSVPSSPAKFSRDFDAAKSALGETGKNLNSKEEVVAALQANIDELQAKLALDVEQQAKLDEFQALKSKLTKLNTAIANAAKTKVDKAVAADKKNRELEASVASRVAPTPTQADTSNVDTLHEKCGKEQIQPLTQGWKATSEALGQTVTDLRGAALKMIKGDRKDSKEAIAKLKEKLFAAVEKASKQGKGGDDFEDKAKKASGADDEGLSFFGIVDKGISVLKEWEQKRSLSLVKGFFDALEAQDEAESREAKVAALSSRFLENFQAFTSKMKNDMIASIGPAEQHCVTQENRMRGAVGQQPQSTGLRGLQGLVVEAKARAFDPTGQVLASNSQNEGILANDINQFSSELARRGENAGTCPQGMSSQVQGLLAQVDAEAQKLTGQTDPQLLIDQAISTVKFASDTYAQAGNLLNQVAGSCTAMATEVKHLEDTKAALDKKASQAGALVPGANQFAGGAQSFGPQQGFQGGALNPAAHGFNR